MRRRPGSTTAAAYLASPTEAGMERTIREAVAWRRGKMWHVRDSRALDVEGMPDLLILVPGLAMMAELKSQRRPVTPEQHEVAALLATVERFWGGIVRPEPKDGETGYDEFLALLRGEG